MATEFSMSLWQEIDNDVEEGSSSITGSDSCVFNIDLDFCYDVLSYFTMQECFSQSIMLPREMVLSEQQGTSILISTFIDMGLPDLTFLQDNVIPFILFLLRCVDAAPTNRGRSVIKLKLMVIVKDSVDYGEDRLHDAELLNAVINESFTSGVSSKPASESAIQGLERMKCANLSSKEQCSICLEEFSYGEDLVKMPCKHIHHDGCIVQWLETSHFCPLCRFEMPS